MKRWIICLLFCIFLTGCEAGSGKGNRISKEETAVAVEVAEDEEAAEEIFAPWTEEERAEFIRFLEQFESGRIFTNMDKNQAEAYGEPLKDTYDFIGRETEDGCGYVLGFQKSSHNLLSSLSIYGLDDHIEAEIWNESKGEYEPVYSFETISDLLYAENYEVLYLQPIDVESPEELESAFRYHDTYIAIGDDGEEIRYVDDVLARGVRFTPPETGAYLAVIRYEDGRSWREYVPLTEAEEQEILTSDEIVDPKRYGYHGLEFYVSPEIYEEQGIEEGPIRMPAVRIAEERCRFVVMELSEIHGLTGVQLTFDGAWSPESGLVFVTQSVTDLDLLKELEEILTSAKPASDGKCPYTGLLRLTRQDGKTIDVSLAMDGCDNFILGSHGAYTLGQENMERIWAMFPEIRYRLDSGKNEPETEESKE